MFDEVMLGDKHLSYDNVGPRQKASAQVGDEFALWSAAVLG